MRARSIALVLTVILAATAVAQQTRDSGGVAPQAVAPSGTAVLTGTLLTETPTPRPVRRATVRLAGAAGTSARLVGTDDQGRFVFSALPAGTFTLSATKIGFVPAFHGSKRPGRGPGVPIAIATGQQLDVAFRMLPGAAITGTVTDLRGKPVATVPVLAVEVRPGRVSQSPPVRAITDDLGTYRIFGLAPGDYVVAALPRLGAGRGAPAPDVISVTDAEAQWARSQSATTSALGAPSGGGTAMPPPGHPVTYAPVYFPSTTDVRAARTISVAAGEERSNVGFAVQIVAATKIAGTLVDDTGQPVTTGAVTLHPRKGAESAVANALISSAALMLPRAVMTPPRFSIAGVTPGDYTLVARTGSAGRGTVAAAASAPPTLWSVSDVTIDGSDQTDLVLRLQPGTAISGSMVFEGSSLAAPGDASRFELSMAAVAPLAGASAAARGVVTPAGTFRFSSLAPGSYVLQATTPPATSGPRWTLKSATLNGRDLADLLLDATPGLVINDLVIRFSDRASEIAGVLVDASSRPVTQYSIIVFTVDRSLWLPQARRIRSTRPATDGTFSVGGLPAGEYAIAAAEDVEASDLADPAFLSQLLASSHRVTVAEGERKTQNLRVGG